jgi:hypothetical protein
VDETGLAAEDAAAIVEAEDDEAPVSEEHELANDEDPPSELEGEEPESEGEIESVQAVNPEQVAALAHQLAEGSLDDALRERLSEWLMAGSNDPTLEQALASLGENPLQLGFDLLAR